MTGPVSVMVEKESSRATSGGRGGRGGRGWRGYDGG